MPHEFREAFNLHVDIKQVLNQALIHQKRFPLTHFIIVSLTSECFLKGVYLQLVKDVAESVLR